MVSVRKYLPFSLVAVIDEWCSYAYRARDHYIVFKIVPVCTKIQFPSQNCSYKYVYYLTPLIVQLFKAALVLPGGRLIRNL
jgi:hypothetical protein